MLLKTFKLPLSQVDERLQRRGQNDKNHSYLTIVNESAGEVSADTLHSMNGANRPANLTVSQACNASAVDPVCVRVLYGLLGYIPSHRLEYNGVDQLPWPTQESNRPRPLSSNVPTRRNRPRKHFQGENSRRYQQGIPRHARRAQRRAGSRRKPRCPNHDGHRLPNAPNHIQHRGVPRSVSSRPLHADQHQRALPHLAALHARPSQSPQSSAPPTARSSTPSRPPTPNASARPLPSSAPAASPLSTAPATPALAAPGPAFPATPTPRAASFTPRSPKPVRSSPPWGPRAACGPIEYRGPQ